MELLRLFKININIFSYLYVFLLVLSTLKILAQELPSADEYDFHTYKTQPPFIEVVKSDAGKKVFKIGICNNYGCQRIDYAELHQEELSSIDNIFNCKAFGHDDSEIDRAFYDKASEGLFSKSKKTVTIQKIRYAISILKKIILKKLPILKRDLPGDEARHLYDDHRKFGTLDCQDTSLNSRVYLSLLDQLGYLKGFQLNSDIHVIKNFPLSHYYMGLFELDSNGSPIEEWIFDDWAGTYADPPDILSQSQMNELGEAVIMDKNRKRYPLKIKACLEEYKSDASILTDSDSAGNYDDYNDELENEFNDFNFLRYNTLKSHMDYLTSKDRRPSEPGHKESREYLMKNLKELGIKKDDIYTLESDVPLMNAWASEHTHNLVPPEKAYNVYGRVRRTQANNNSKYLSCIALTTHYDGLKKNAANDNATGVSALLDVARDITQIKDRSVDVFFIFTDLEEMALSGAEAAFDHVNSMCDKILLNINLDMVGKPAHSVFNNQLFIFNSQITPLTNDLLTQTSNISPLDVVTFPLDFVEFDVLPGVDVSRSDYRFFKKNDVPVLFYTTGVPWNYHSESDQLKHVEFELLVNVTAHLSSLLSNLLDKVNENVFSGTPPDFWLNVEKNKLIQQLDKILKDENIYPELWQFYHIRREYLSDYWNNVNIDFKTLQNIGFDIMRIAKYEKKMKSDKENDKELKVNNPFFKVPSID